MGLIVAGDYELPTERILGAQFALEGQTISVTICFNQGAPLRLDPHDSVAFMTSLIPTMAAAIRRTLQLHTKERRP